MLVRIWAKPVLIAVLGFVGLISALIGDGLWDAVSWLALGTPIAVLIWHDVMRRPRRT